MHEPRAEEKPQFSLLEQRTRKDDKCLAPQCAQLANSCLPAALAKNAFRKYDYRVSRAVRTHKLLRVGQLSGKNQKVNGCSVTHLRLFQLTAGNQALRYCARAGRKIVPMCLRLSCRALADCWMCLVCDDVLVHP